jgi:hypothetical protein
MRALGISLMVVGLALICGALALWPPPRTSEEEQAETQNEEAGEMTGLPRRRPDDTA